MMNDRDIRKAKTFNYSVFTVLSVLIILLLCFILYLSDLPIDPYLQTDQLARYLRYTDLALVNGICYELKNGEMFDTMIHFEVWVQSESKQPTAHILTLKLMDEYELAFYEGGWAQAYYGYSDWKHQDKAWYQVPETLSAALADYVEENGTVRESYLGASSWFELAE